MAHRDLGYTLIIVFGLLTGFIQEVAADPLDEPLQLIARARAAHAQIRDYTCQLIKQERIGGELSAVHVIDLKVRVHPHSVHMLWKEPRHMAGQEACYVAGENAGKMRVRPAGLLGNAGFFSVALDDARVRKMSRHPINEAGIGSLLETCGKGWAAERDWKQTEVRMGTYEFVKRRCRRAELIHADPAGGKFLFHRNVVYFDEQTGLPIRLENYDWPRQPGSEGELVEMISFIDLKCNLGLTDTVFRPGLELRRRR